MQIEGKLAVVTGAAVGTGRAIATRLAAEGARVVLADVDEAAGAEAAAEIGAAASFRATDMRDDEAVAALLACRPDILVNNAGGGAVLRPCFPDATAERWSASLDLNLRAPMLATQLVLDPMRAAGGGAVVNLGSTAGRGLGPHVSPEYSAAKAGLIRFTATLAPLRESHGVRVNCVVPDWVATERGVAERAALPADERGPELVPLETLTDAVVRLVTDDELAGRVVLLDRGRPPELLPA
ncbi:short-chain dehydrogenase/reductase SDR [Kribbella flavida DSM 17836]|uniref:Short-chain dehydrogenase/reductase SDR n=1 Tax=Kribbella flavida (strain DSM 17836 / JCM 10339 / NBRC 14399) TaxID=479435 RepID=D2PKU7_KRIFD|nr:SDR family NAD(P)-dependent oxidoreductase [Kribbella flavida]ADB32414.1 short-chain dehydrogenase/reductase SDR [Kribbella flavida DSM 17836]